MEDIYSVWETIFSMIVLQYTEIITSFDKNVIQKLHQHSNRFYANLCGVVSKIAVDDIVVACDLRKYVGIDKF